MLRHFLSGRSSTRYYLPSLTGCVLPDMPLYTNMDNGIQDYRF